MDDDYYEPDFYYEPPDPPGCPECGSSDVTLTRQIGCVQSWCCQECGDSWEDEEPERDYPDPLDGDLIDGVGFADPGGHSALRAATHDNPRDQPCPTCGMENVLTRLDVRRGYQCDRCADAVERGAP